MSKQSCQFTSRSMFLPSPMTCEPWVVTERVRLLIQVVEIGRGAWSQCRATTYQKDTVGHLGWMPPGRLKGEVLWTFSTGRKPQGRSRTFRRDYVFCWLGNTSLWPGEELGEVLARGRSLFRPLEDGGMSGPSDSLVLILSSYIFPVQCPY